MPVGAPDWGRVGFWSNVLAGPGKANGVELIYRAKRVFTYSGIKLAVDADAYVIELSNADLVPSANLTWDSTAIYTDNAIDHDDTTYGGSGTVLSAGEVRTMLVVDLGSLLDVFVYVKHESAVTSLPSRIYTSSDCSSYNLVSEAAGSTEIVVLRDNIRCIKWEIANNTTSSASPVQRLYSIEAYRPSTKSVVSIGSLTTDTLTVIVDNGYYFLYELVYDTVPGWG